ncbi:hypothetical protein F511_30608 [Dorcoceras hygrometricum]|uniref:Uncharacterized protein n=1 Tax=Dorcoceras hygrometricum TaxID=472368 RepID=A0A2Z7CZV1_9LAMI|nr:hypothetical protein F511_30608 [Dorcoceras hygrometricum]
MLISSVLLVQADEGVSFLVVDRIGDYYRSLPRRADVIVTTVGARHKCQQGSGFEPPIFGIGRKIKNFRELATGRRRVRRPLPVRISRAHMDAHIACAGRRSAQVVALVVAHGVHVVAAERCCNRRKKLRQRAARLPSRVRPMVGAALAHDGATHGRSVHRPGAVHGAMISPPLRYPSTLAGNLARRWPAWDATLARPALSVIPRGSWGDVARRSYHDPLGKSGIVIPEPQWFRYLSTDITLWEAKVAVSSYPRKLTTASGLPKAVHS